MSSSKEAAETPGQFVHLHVHTQYSLLQGAIHVESLLDRVSELGMPAVAVTDTNNLFGAIDFYLQAKKKKIKPILGCEILYAPQGRNTLTAQGNQSSGPRFYHLVLLCKNLQGYQNLCQMVTRAYTEAPPPQKGQPAGPRALIDRELLNRWGNDLIVLSGCLRGELASRILMGDEATALESLQWFKKRFGEDFFLELQDSGIPEQEQVNQVLFGWGQSHGVSCVATVDCHYLEPAHGEAHEVLQCIEHGRNLDSDRPKSLVPHEFYLKPAALMRERFEHFPGACDNTLLINDRCQVDFRFKDAKGRPIYHLPNFRPDGVSKEDQSFDLGVYLKEQSRLGLDKRFADLSFAERKTLLDWTEREKIYRTRLEDELAMIEKTGFSGYFLIVADFINWAKERGVPVGPGRGSGAGSLVAYALRITDVDPIQFKLLFERFINPERISLPDFDVDFCQDRRGEVIDYVSKKYGLENVCQIITFGKLQARAVLKDVGRVLGLTFAETDQLTKLMPDELHITIDAALEKEPRLREKMEQEPKLAKVIEYARALEGLYRNAGMHAAGVIITERPVVEYCPLFVGRDGATVTQLDKDSAEAIGLVKFDFLGLKTLTVIDHAIKLIRLRNSGGIRGEGEEARKQEDFRIEEISDRDSKVFALIGSGDTDGVFQVESSGMKDLCVRIQPSSIEDLTAINALYRPGPLGSGMVDDFIDRKHGRNPIVYDVPTLEPILKDTYGVILYQEQVMQIARELAGYSLGQADLLRRAMGKKKHEEMAEHREIFVKGATAQGLSAEKAQGIFDLMAKFAEYGFNKSHSAAYALLTYQTAYLKTHFSAEFMAALMTTEMDNTDKITKYIGDARAHAIPVLSPDVNASQKRFSVEDRDSVKAIRFGLEAIKGVGGIAVDAILEARGTNPFRNVVDFCSRVSTRKVNKKVLESLTMAGAFDTISEVNRASLFASLEAVLEQASDEQEERELGQSSLFDAFRSDEVKLTRPSNTLFKNEEDWPNSRKLMLEKQVVGFYVSGHPMDTWQKICEEWLGWTTGRIKKQAEEKSAALKPVSQPGAVGASPWGGYRPQRPEVKLGGLVSEIREVMTKKGTRMAFGQFEDLQGKVEVVFFPEAYAACQEILKRSVAEALPLLMTGELEVSEENPKIFAKSLEWLGEAHENRVTQVVLRLDPGSINGAQLRDLKKSLLGHRGKCPVRIEFQDSLFKTHLELPQALRVSPTVQLVKAVNGIFGAEVVRLT